MPHPPRRSPARQAVRGPRAPRASCAAASLAVLLVLLLLLLLPGCEANPVQEAPLLPGEVQVTPWVGLDPDDGSPVLILDENDGSRRLPIWIGYGEARSIQARLSAQVPPRPNTHDLAMRLLEQVDGRIARVVVTELRDGIYYAHILLQHDGELTEVDARPSDATALAVRTGSPVFVREELFEQSGNEQAPRGREVRHRTRPATDAQLHTERL